MVVELGDGDAPAAGCRFVGCHPDDGLTGPVSLSYFVLVAAPSCPNRQSIIPIAVCAHSHGESQSRHCMSGAECDDVRWTQGPRKLNVCGALLSRSCWKDA